MKKQHNKIQKKRSETTLLYFNNMVEYNNETNMK